MGLILFGSDQTEEFATMTESMQGTSPSVLVITALPEEFSAFVSGLQDVQHIAPSPGAIRSYVSGTIVSPTKPSATTAVLATCLHGMGRVRAAAATSEAINRWRPTLVVMVGIAGGVANNGVAVGDVLVADQIIDYELGKLRESGQVSEKRYETYRCCPGVVARASEYALQQGPYSIHVGTIASGDKVVADSRFLTSILSDWPRLIGIEMEGAGVAHAAWFSAEHPRFAMVRGVSDLADANKDSGKNKSMRSEVCDRAAFVATRLIGAMPPSLSFPVVGKSRLLPNSRILALRESAAKDALSGADPTSIHEQLRVLRREIRSRPSLQPGDHLANGRFLLLERLGYGGFADVWKAFDVPCRGYVALKILHQHWCADRTRLERFSRGARQMRRLGHPHIVAALDEVAEEDGVFFFPMVLIDGFNLRDAVIKELAPRQQLLEGLVGIADALLYAHQKGVVHRDIKPQNVLVQDKAAFLADFDLARAFDTTAGTRTAGMGSFVYAAPEAHVDASQAGPSADVYSLAMTALFVMYGEDLPLDVVRDAPAFALRMNWNVELTSAVAAAVAWNPRERLSLLSFRNSMARSLQGQTLEDGGFDPPGWLRVGFSKTTRRRYEIPYTDLRRGPHWTAVRDALGQYCASLMNKLERAFLRGERWAPERDNVLASLSLETFERLLGLRQVLDSERVAMRWLICRRLVLGVSSRYAYLVAGKRSRLEALLVAFFNFAPGDHPQPNYIRDSLYLNYLTSLRPMLSQLGLKPGDLCKGAFLVGTLGTYEQEWIEEHASPLAASKLKLPDWWSGSQQQALAAAPAHAPESLAQDGPSDIQLRFFSVSRSVLDSAIEIALSSISADEMRPNLCHSLLLVAPDKLTTASTDGHRLHVGSFAVSPGLAIEPFLLHRSSLLHVARVLDETMEESCGVAYHSGYLYLRVGDRMFPFETKSARQWVPWESMLEWKTWARFSARTSEVLEQIRLVQASRSDGGETVIFTCEDRSVLFESGAGDKRLAVKKVTGKPCRVGFNSSYLADVLELCRTPTVDLRFCYSKSTPVELSPCVVSPLGDIDLRCVVMPLRL